MRLNKSLSFNPKGKVTTVAKADGTISIDDLFEVAYSLRDEREATLEKQAANREILRNLDVSGMLPKERSEELAEIYPVRTRERKAEEAAEASS